MTKHTLKTLGVYIAKFSIMFAQLLREKLNRGANSEAGENPRLWRVIFSILF